MARCFKGCKNYYKGFCTKYFDKVLESKSPYHIGLPLHPLSHLELYYKEDEDDIDHLIDVADKFSNGDEVIDNICNYFARYGQISFKQRKLLLYKLLNCYEEKEPEPRGMDFYQVED